MGLLFFNATYCPPVQMTCRHFVCKVHGLILWAFDTWQEISLYLYIRKSQIKWPTSLAIDLTYPSWIRVLYGCMRFFKYINLSTSKLLLHIYAEVTECCITFVLEWIELLLNDDFVSRSMKGPREYRPALTYQNSTLGIRNHIRVFPTQS